MKINACVDTTNDQSIVVGGVFRGALDLGEGPIGSGDTTGLHTFVAAFRDTQTMPLRLQRVHRLNAGNELKADVAGDTLLQAPTAFLGGGFVGSLELRIDEEEHISSLDSKDGAADMFLFGYTF